MDESVCAEGGMRLILGRTFSGGQIYKGNMPAGVRTQFFKSDYFLVHKVFSFFAYVHF